MPQVHKLSEIKTDISNVIANLQLLEGLSNASPDDLDLKKSRQLKEQTTKLLAKLNELPCDRIARIQLQRKRRRQRAKKRDKLQRSVKRDNPENAKDKALPSESDVAAAAHLPVQRQAEHITLKKQHDATNMLHTFDLLEKLYKARGGNKDLTEKLSRMRTVWRSVLQECTDEINKESTTNCEAQWARVIFGSSSLSLRQGNMDKKRNTQELIQRRFIWDSYISYGKSGSSIPHGWVLPTDMPTAEWARYKCE
ncbi:uncharacterized protein [Drosophila virilis]|uniref:Uncharacterized protein n=1 Tax=Drosophila virilis TaxID=7244 RepID=B4M0X9_DROVI|nr:uncharacterized protein LOC6629329 [Drosophila virilis]EDW67390.1 uncharacterized protein Dvir_GJ23105 [Drosophila virilis]